MNNDSDRGTSIYFAQADYGGPIKIGHSYNRSQRIEDIAKPLPFRLVEIGSFPGGLFGERFIQSWFRANQIKGEWFEPTPELWRWALQARTKKAIPEVPPDPPWQFAGSGQSIRFYLDWLDIKFGDVAASASLTETYTETRLSAAVITSKSLLAAVAVCIVRRGEFFNWNRIEACFDDIAAAKATGNEVAPVDEVAAA